MSTLIRGLRWLSHEFGLTALWQSGSDAWIIILQRSLRMFGFGVVNLILALFFHELGFRDDQIGFFFSCTLWGDVLLSLLLTVVADKLGRRNILIVGSLLMVGAGIAFALSDNYYVLLAAAVLGVISVSGSEIGPFRAIEESTLAHLTTPETRTYVLTWYVVIATLGSAFGIALCGVVVDGLRPEWSQLRAYHFVFWIYAIVGAVNLILSLFLSKECELDSKPKPSPANQPNDAAETGDPNSETRPLLGDQNGRESADGSDDDPKKERKSIFSGISKESQGVLFRLSLIMFIDSFASGMVPFSLINYYVDGKFHLPKKRLGEIMSVTWAFSAISNMFAGSIARRIGLIKTMVFTHLPSAVFLALLPVPQSLTFTILLLLARACLSSMDQGPRSAFISAVVKPEERTAVMGIVNVLKTLAQSAGPWTTGGLANHGLFWVAFVTAGSLKGTYDLLLLIFFVNATLHKHEKLAEADDGSTGEEDEDAAQTNEGQNQTTPA
jgi:MFS family permease